MHLAGLQANMYVYIRLGTVPVIYLSIFIRFRQLPVPVKSYRHQSMMRAGLMTHTC